MDPRKSSKKSFQPRSNTVPATNGHSFTFSGGKYYEGGVTNFGNDYNGYSQLSGTHAPSMQDGIRPQGSSNAHDNRAPIRHAFTFTDGEYYRGGVQNFGNSHTPETRHSTHPANNLYDNRSQFSAHHQSDAELSSTGSSNSYSSTSSQNARVDNRNVLPAPPTPSNQAPIYAEPQPIRARDEQRRSQPPSAHHTSPTSPTPRSSHSSHSRHTSGRSRK